MLEWDLCDIWRVRNPTLKRCTWSGAGQGKRSCSNEKIHRRLDFFLISDELQAFVDKCDIIPAPSTDHSAIVLNLSNFEEGVRGPSFWKFNNSLLNNQEYTRGMQANIHQTKKNLDHEGIFDYQLRWELIKYQIRKFSIAFSKSLAKKRKNEYQRIEKEIIEIEERANWHQIEDLVILHDTLKKELEDLSDYITNGIILRSKAQWYEMGEKNNKYFLTLERRNKAKTHVKKLINKDNIEIIEEVQILKEIEIYFNSLYRSRSNKTPENCSSFF